MTAREDVWLLVTETAHEKRTSVYGTRDEALHGGAALVFDWTDHLPPDVIQELAQLYHREDWNGVLRTFARHQPPGLRQLGVTPRQLNEAEDLRRMDRSVRQRFPSFFNRLRE